MKSCILLSLVAYLTAVQATITGSQSCNNYLCVRGTHDDQAQTDTYTLTPPNNKQLSRDNFGWIAIGFGSTMANSPMVIVWPNSDGSMTLSQRQAPGEIAPSVVSNPSRTATLDTTKSFSNSSATSFTFTVPAVSGASSSDLNRTSLIWAYSSKNPGSSDSSAAIVQHDGSGTMTLQLLAPLSNSGSSTTAGSTTGTTTGSAPSGSTTGNSDGSNTGDSSGSSSSTSSGQSTTVLLAHAICGALATLVFLPLGVLIPRFARGLSLNRWWFPAHGIVNGVLGALLVIICYAIARVKFHKDAKFDNSSHRHLGLALFLLILLQVALGCFVHWYKSSMINLQTKAGRGPSNFIHMVLGVGIIGLGYATTWQGMTDEWSIWGPSPVKMGYKAGFWVLVAAAAALYLFGLIYFFPKQRRLEQQAYEAHAGPVASGLAYSQHAQGIEMGPSRSRKDDVIS